MKSLASKAKRGLAAVSPEDLFELVWQEHDHQEAAKELRRLSVDFDWPHSPCPRLTPMGSWADAVCAILEGGVPGLVQRATDAEDLQSADAAEELRSIACETLEGVMTSSSADSQRVPEALQGLLKLASIRAKTVPLASALSEILYAHPAQGGQLEGEIRELIHSRIAASESHNDRFVASLVLDHVGDEHSIALLESLSQGLPLQGEERTEWADRREEAVRAIRRRIAAKKRRK